MLNSYASLPLFPQLSKPNAFARPALFLLLSLLPWNAALAKDIPVTGILIYGPSG